MSQGIYISVPFCRTKCSFCNFASGVFSRAAFDGYVEQLCREVSCSHEIARQLGGLLERNVDSIYLGGGTPSVLAPAQLKRIFTALRDAFQVQNGAEITVECAPGTLSNEILETLLKCGVNRVSLGVQSFVDQECSSVGRLHTHRMTLADIARLRAAGIDNISIDLIAGLPHQTAESWEVSLHETLASGVPHVSVYMLEVDEDSRLGAELLAGGTRYHAHFVPDDDLTADLYLAACERLERGEVRQYEISNFARPRTHGVGLWDSRHNLKYWTRQPYLGFGVDAHSMLPAAPALQVAAIEAVRFAASDSLEAYSQQLAVADCPLPGSTPGHRAVAARIEQLNTSRMLVDREAALEECFFLGLRLNGGVSVADLRARFGNSLVDPYASTISEMIEAGLLEQTADGVKLTARGRLLSNEVFARFLREDGPAAVASRS